MENRYDVWNPADIARRKPANKGGQRKWKKARKHVKRELLR